MGRVGSFFCTKKHPVDFLQCPIQQKYNADKLQSKNERKVSFLAKVQSDQFIKFQ